MLSRSEPSPIDERTFMPAALGDVATTGNKLDCGCDVGAGGGWAAGGWRAGGTGGWRAGGAGGWRAGGATG